MKKTTIILFLTSAILCAATTISYPTQRNVPADYSTIQAALNVCVTGDVVQLAAGTFSGTGNSDILWPDVDAITLRGLGTIESKVIRTTSLVRVIKVNTAVSLTIEALTIQSGYFSGNSSGGAGIYLPPGCRLTLNRVYFYANIVSGAGSFGGAVYSLGSTVEATECIFTSNQATSWNAIGGAMYGGEWHAYRCIFQSNVAGSSAGEGGVAKVDTFIATNCAFVNNSARTHGCVGSINNSYWYLMNCTFRNNNTGTFAIDTIYQATAFSGTLEAVNCIFWGTGAQLSTNVTGSLKYCDVIGGWGQVTTTECFSWDPRFVSTSDNHIKFSSPCESRGTTEGAPPKDLDNVPRPYYKGIAIGCYEYAGPLKVHNVNQAKHYLTIDWALYEASAADLITLEGDTYYEHDIDWLNRSGITLRGAGSNETIISAEALGRVISVEGAVALTLESLTIMGGFKTGTSPNHGGGIYLPKGSFLKLYKVNFYNNYTGASGGAINSWGSTIEAERCSFRNNISASQGGVGLGGIWNVNKCRFMSNQATSNSGVISTAYGGDTMTATNCVFSLNSSVNGGVFGWIKVSATNCTFLNNSATSGTVGYFGTYECTNCILSGPPVVFVSGTGTLRYCMYPAALSAGFTTVECLIGSPDFLSTAEGADYLQLGPTSNCIDAGTNETGVPTDDAIDVPRPQGYRPDMGAFELIIKDPEILTSTLKLDGEYAYTARFITKKPTIEVDIRDIYLVHGNTSIEVRLGGVSYFITPEVDLVSNIAHVICSTEVELGVGLYDIRIIARNVYGATTQYLKSSLRLSNTLSVSGPTKNNPNPFKPRHRQGTYLIYNLSNAANIKIYIYDIRGRLIWQRNFFALQEGGKINENRVYWDGMNDFGSYIANGVYIYLITSDEKILAKGQMAVVD